MAFEMLLSQDGFLFLETLSNTAATAVVLIDRLRFFFLSVFFARWYLSVGRSHAEDVILVHPWQTRYLRWLNQEEKINLFFY